MMGTTLGAQNPVVNQTVIAFMIIYLSGREKHK